jgi:hypothetical protein
MRRAVVTVTVSIGNNSGATTTEEGLGHHGDLARLSAVILPGSLTIAGLGGGTDRQNDRA